MNNSSMIKKAAGFKALSLLPLALLAGCGPQSQGFSILAKAQSAFQGNEINNKVDVLFVVDSSGSMKAKQDKLAAGFSSFIQDFQTKGFDYHIAVVSMDYTQGGVFHQGGTSPVVSSASSSALQTSDFQSNIAVGDSGSSNNTGMKTIEMALDPSNSANVATNFLRSDAHLAVIAVSDADDMSTQNLATTGTAGFGTYTPVDTTNLVSYLTALKPDVYDEIGGQFKHNFTISTVGVRSSDMYSSSCNEMENAYEWLAQYGTMAGYTPNYSTPNFTLYEVATDFISLANQTNGSVASLCASDYSGGLETISQTIIQAITQIPLSTVPQLSTLSVTFNGVLVPNDPTNGWTYLSAGNKIVFSGTAIPTPNTSISVNYTPNDITR